MISISKIGILIILLIYLPKFLLVLFPAKDRIIIKYTSKEKQIEILEKISFLGCLLFSFVEIEQFGYKFLNLGLQIAWIIIILIIFLFNYFCYLRFFLNGRKYDNLYDRVLIPYPIGISEALIFIVSASLLLNIFVLIFSVIYIISHTFLGYRRK